MIHPAESNQSWSYPDATTFYPVGQGYGLLFFFGGRRDVHRLLLEELFREQRIRRSRPRPVVTTAVRKWRVAFAFRCSYYDGRGDWLAPTMADNPISRAVLTFSTSLLRRAKKIRRKLRRKLLLSVLGSAVRLHRAEVRVRTQIARPQLRVIVIAVFALAVMGLGLSYLRHVSWHGDSQKLVTSGTLPQLEIAVGAAMIGVIGIVFSLSIFSIQQVAERGTAFTVREYALDWVFRIVYWALACFAFLAMLSALQEKESGTYGIWLNLGILLASILVIKVYFDRAIKFIDPHFTISKVATRARKLLNRIQRVEGAVRAELRYERSRRRT